MKEHQFRKLLIWQKSMVFITKIYATTGNFPRTEQFGLIDQIRRAASSIALNIAEGSGSSSNQEFTRFLFIARRSAYEVISGLEIAINLHYGNERELVVLIKSAEEICSMIVGFSKTLKDDKTGRQ